MPLPDNFRVLHATDTKSSVQGECAAAEQVFKHLLRCAQLLTFDPEAQTNPMCVKADVVLTVTYCRGILCTHALVSLHYGPHVDSVPLRTSLVVETMKRSYYMMRCMRSLL